MTKSLLPLIPTALALLAVPASAQAPAESTPPAPAAVFGNVHYQAPCELDSGAVYLLQAALDSRGRLRCLDTRGELHTLDARTGKPLDRVAVRSALKIEGGLLGIVLTSDGKYVCGMDFKSKGLRPYDLENGRALDPIETGAVGSYSVDAGPNGWVVIISNRRKVIVIDPGAGKTVMSLQQDEGAVASAAVSPDGKWIACVLGNRQQSSVVLHEVAGGATRTLAEGLPFGATLDFSPDSRRLLIAADVTSAVVTLQGEKTALALPEAGDLSFGRWSPDGKKVVLSSRWTPNRTTGEMPKMGLFDAGTGKNLWLRRRACKPGVLLYTPDGKELLAGGTWCELTRLDPATGEAIGPAAHHAPVRSIAWSPDGRSMASTADDGSALAWTAQDGSLQAVLALEGEPGVVQFAMDGQVLLATPDRLRWWDLKTGRLPRPFSLALPEPLALTWNPGRGAMAALSAGKVVWLDFSQDSLDEVTLSQAWLAGLLPDGNRFLAANLPNQLSLRSLQTQDSLVEMTVDGVPTVAGISPDGLIAAVVLRGRQVSRIGGPSFFERDGRLVLLDLVGARPMMIVGAADDYRQGWAGAEPTDVAVAAMDPAGRLVAMGSSRGEVRVWSIPRGRVIWSTQMASDRATTMAFSPDGQRLAVGGRNGQVSVYSLQEALAVKADERPLSDEQLEQLWRLLEGDDARPAYAAMVALQKGGERAAGFLARRVAAPDARRDPATFKTVAELVKGLQARTHAERQQASEALREMGVKAAPALAEALEDDTLAAEARARIAALLKEIARGGPVTDSMAIARLRAAAALRYLDEGAARKALVELSQREGQPEAAAAARAALAGLGAEAPAPPARP